MTSTDRLAEMALEIDRLRTRIAELDRIVAERTAEAERLKAEYAVTYGSFRASVLDEPDEPATITHNVPPSAPPHDEPKPPVGHTIRWPSSMSEPDPDDE